MWLIIQALKICKILWRNWNVKSKWLYPEDELIKHSTFHQYHNISSCFSSFNLYHFWDIFMHQTLSKVAPPPHSCPKHVLASKAIWAHISCASLPTLQLDEMHYCHMCCSSVWMGKSSFMCLIFFFFPIAHITVPEKLRANIYINA